MDVGFSSLNMAKATNIFKQVKTQELMELEDVKYSKTLDDKQKLKYVAQEFESIFVKMVVDGLKKTEGQGGLFEKSFASNTFEDMLTTERSKMIARQADLGIARMIYEQYQPSLDTVKASEVSKKI